MPIPLINNFSINVNAPIDDRIIASSSIYRDSISYKYDGLQVFTKDDRTFWVYNESSATWSNLLGGFDSMNGIYGGSGSLPDNIYINSGNISPTTVDSNSYKLIISGSSSNKVYYSSFFRRHSSTGNWSGVEFRNQFSYDSNTSSNSYIAYNTYDSISNTYGGIDFGTSNKKQLSLTSDGVFRSFAKLKVEDYIRITYSPTFSGEGKQSIYSIQSITFSDSLSSLGENIYANILTDNFLNIDYTGILPFDSNNNISSVHFRNIINLQGTSLQLAPTTYGINSISAINVSHKSNPSFNSGSITSLSGLRVDGYKPNTGSFLNTLSLQNYYGVLINPSYEVTGKTNDPYYQAGYNTINISNKYGIYQVSPYDKNYFAGKVGIGTAPTEGNNLTVGGTVSFLSATWSSAGITSWLNSGGYIASDNSGTTFYPVSYKVFNNTVELAGAVQYVYPGAGTRVIFQLPQKTWPSRRVVLNHRTQVSSNMSNILIDPDGKVYAQTFGAGTDYLSFDGISYRKN